MEVNESMRAALVGGRFTEAACSSDTISLYSLTNCYWAGKSPFCDIVIGESPVYGKVLFLDKELQSAEADEAIYHEHLVHPVMNAVAGRGGSVKRVLIVGGGEGATAREVLKWKEVEAVDWVDIDGGLVDLCRRHLSWADDYVYNDPRLRYFAADIRQFFIQDAARYDIIILDLPDPDVDELKVAATMGGEMYLLYSLHFWQELRIHLAPGGAVVSHCGPIQPGGDPEMRRAGLDWIIKMSQHVGLGSGFPYHVCIPSFQSEWGFWMSVPPCKDDTFPAGLAVMDSEAQQVAFTWPRYWTSPYIGLGAGGSDGGTGGTPSNYVR